MIKKLLIKNYALIESLEMQPDEGLNIVTGETGAGKSILLGAIGLLLGNRADVKTLLNPEDKCVVEALFDVRNYNLSGFFVENDLDYDVQVLVRREINPAGKSRAFVNDTPVTLDVLKNLGAALVDIHSQHDNLLLSVGEYVLTLIDSYAELAEDLADYQKVYFDWKKADKELKSFEAEVEELKKETDFNRFLWNELEKAALQPGEYEELEQELAMQVNADKIKSGLTETLHLLDAGELSVNSLLTRVRAALQAPASVGKPFSDFLERVEQCRIELNDLAREVADVAEGAEASPERIDAIQARISLIEMLRKKHRVSTETELLEIKNAFAVKLEKADFSEEELTRLRREKEQKETAALETAAILSTKRSAVFAAFESELTGLLADLGMPHATVRFEKKNVPLHRRGTDELALLFSANKGFEPKDIKSVASGGEFSRLMFAVKYIMAGKKHLPTVIFDEIDTGISGEIALKMGAMMTNMATAHQVITITHLPQIAGKGTAHYHVYKDNTRERTDSKIRRLSPEERTAELAGMIGGTNFGEAALAGARELLGYTA